MKTRKQTGQTDPRAEDTMYVRRTYLKFVEAKSFTTAFRPGNRTNGHPKGYHPGEIVELKVLEEIGADWANLPPRFLNGAEKLIRIISTEQRPLGSLEEEDFIGSTPDVNNRYSLRYHLALIYNLDVRELKDDFPVTKTTFEYI